MTAFRWLSLAAVLISASAGCAVGHAAAPAPIAPVSVRPVVPAMVSTSARTSPPATPSLVAHRTTASPAGARRVNGVVLPDPRRTPGATNPAVTPATISSTICVPGWTARVRPSSSYTTALKRQQLATGYARHGDTNTGDYEEDHLIPLELGGSPSSPANLWPEPYSAPDNSGATSKDSVENRLHALVCSGALGLRTAQRAIAANWVLAGRQYAAASVPTSPSRSSSAPAHRGCTRTSSGSCIRRGQFCPKRSYGQKGYGADGTRYTCTGSRAHPRWE